MNQPSLSRVSAERFFLTRRDRSSALDEVASLSFFSRVTVTTSKQLKNLVIVISQKLLLRSVGVCVTETRFQYFSSDCNRRSASDVVKDRKEANHW